MLVGQQVQTSESRVSSFTTFPSLSTTVLFNDEGASSPFRASSQTREASLSPLATIEARACLTGLRSLCHITGAVHLTPSLEAETYRFSASPPAGGTSTHSASKDPPGNEMTEGDSAGWRKN